MDPGKVSHCLTALTLGPPPGSAPPMHPPPISNDPYFYSSSRVHKVPLEVLGTWVPLERRYKKKFAVVLGEFGEGCNQMYVFSLPLEPHDVMFSSCPQWAEVARTRDHGVSVPSA